jgi:hypothetical protein
MFGLLIYCLEKYEKHLNSRDSMCDLVDDKDPLSIEQMYKIRTLCKNIIDRFDSVTNIP